MFTVANCDGPPKDRRFQLPQRRRRGRGMGWRRRRTVFINLLKVGASLRRIQLGLAILNDISCGLPHVPRLKPHSTNISSKMPPYSSFINIRPYPSSCYITITDDTEM
jgi:hypothetical protein